MPTIPEAPPAIIPSAAVGGSSAVVRARIAPAIRQSPSVAAQTSEHRQPRVGERAQRLGLQVGAERDAGDGLRSAEEALVDRDRARPRERDREPDQQRREQVRGRQPDQVEEQAAADDGGRYRDPEAYAPLSRAACSGDGASGRCRRGR